MLYSCSLIKKVLALQLQNFNQLPHFEILKQNKVVYSEIEQFPQSSSFQVSRILLHEQINNIHGIQMKLREKLHENFGIQRFVVKISNVDFFTNDLEYENVF